ncbi:hypothetical protein L228DRAFT_227756 [Xylona heveae TC161]|uniref:Zn(2)-C6 fungal-type domain-containing protein n=1 Tax=Xylona heveae (strain CBS 132557 / TC161) TaxID=1328760 RepID=A0A165HU37_XYLHT|nr:hypothetical protein L228DRAFT_227756 [Xylona heveae TC161]KZF23929.1 hypothetical protein L228DRAFT_227756 [Xylona heveae TC161]
MSKVETESPIRTAPVAKRLRVGDRTLVACLGCKQRKQKCDGQSPTCRNCRRAGRECLVEDPTTKRHQPRGYLQSLEERVAFLEGMLQSVNPDVARDHLGQKVAAERAFSTEQPQATASDTISSTSKDALEDEKVDDLSSEVGLLCLHAAGREPHYFGSSSGFAFTKVLNSSLKNFRSQGPGISLGCVNDSSLNTRSIVPPCPLPSKPVASMLTQAYFENIHTQYPFLHRPTFEKWEADVMAARDGEPRHVDSIMLFFLYMVYAVASMIVPFNPEGSAEGYNAAAQQHMDYVIQLDTVESIQAILCCAMYSLRSPVGVSIWTLSGFALRQCMELGLHRNTRKYYRKQDPLRFEIGKRVFWCSYGLDRAAAITLGRPFGIMDKDIDVEYPLDIDDAFIDASGFHSAPRSNPADPPTSISSAIHTFRLRRIWSRINESLYPSVISADADILASPAVVQQLREELDGWHASTPPQLPPISAALSTFTSQEWFQLAYDHSVLMLYRKHLTTEYASRDANAGAIFLECTACAREICHLYRRLYIHHPVSYTWGSVHILFLAGLTYLHCLWTSPVQDQNFQRNEVYGTCTACTMVLVVMAERWSAAASYRDIFETLAGKTMSMVCDRENGVWLAPNEPIMSFEQDPDMSLMNEWIMNAVDVGMCGGVEKLLSDLVGDPFSSL